MGYGMGLTPKTSLDDGWLDLFVVPELTLFQKLKLIYRVLTQNVESFSKGTHTLIKSIKIEEPVLFLWTFKLMVNCENLKPIRFMFR